MTIAAFDQKDKSGKIVLTLCCLTALFIPFKIGLAYGAMIPLMLAYFIVLARGGWRNLQPTAVELPLWTLIGVAALCSFFGFDPERSLLRAFSFVGFLLLLRAFAHCYQSFGVVPLLFLLTGQSLSGFVTILNHAFPDQVPRMFLGRVTESGQLGVCFVLALSYLVASFVWPEQKVGFGLHLPKKPSRMLCLYSFLQTAVLVALSFAPIGKLPLLFLATALLAAGLILAERGLRIERVQRFMFGWVIPILVAALLSNLKRGPWVGAFVALVIISFFLWRRILLFAFVGVLFALTVTPIRDRLMQSSRDFYIEGGRNVIWNIGYHLLPRYPLGIGFANNGDLREYSFEVPRYLKHFHSNLLNISVELGFLGGAIFLWWIVVVLRQTFRPAQGPERVLWLAAGAAFLSFQVAGIIEYNIGDTEVLVVLLSVLAILVARQFSIEVKSDTVRG